MGKEKNEGLSIEQLKLKLHREYLDPLWRSAALRPCYQAKLKQRPYLITDISKRARERVYEWLAFQLHRNPRDIHIQRMDRLTCLMAIEALEGVDYETIRTWAMNRDARRKAAAKRAKEAEKELPKPKPAKKGKGRFIVTKRQRREEAQRRVLNDPGRGGRASQHDQLAAVWKSVPNVSLECRPGSDSRQSWRQEVQGGAPGLGKSRGRRGKTKV